jgi:PST family polysaccharide transporter
MTGRERFDQLIAEAEGRSTLKQRAIRGGGYNMASEAIDFVMRVGSIMVLARILLPEHFGLIGMVTAITMLAERFKDLGLAIATVQRPVITHEQVSTLFWVNAALGLTAAVVVAALAWPIARFYGDERVMHITLAIAVTFIWGGLAVQHQALLRRSMRFRAIAAIHVGSSAASIVVAIALAMAGFGFWALVAREIARSVFVTLGTWSACRWVPGGPKKGTGVRSMLSFGGHLTAVQFAYVFSMNFGHILMGKLFGAHPLGMYRQGYQLVLGPVAQLSDPIHSVTEATLSRLQGDREAYRRYYRKLLTLVSALTMPIVALIFVHATAIVRVVLGPAWLEAVPIFRVLALAAFISPAFGTISAVIVTCGHIQRYFRLGMLNAAVLIAFGFLGTYWGPTGIAASHVALYLTMLGPRLYWGLQGTPVDSALFARAIARPAIASLVMGLLLHLVEAIGLGLGAVGTLVVACLAGPPLFLLAWYALPGGRTEVSGLFGDIRSALAR